MSAEQPGYLPAPPGVIPDLENPTQYGHMQGYILFGVGMALATSLLVVRLYTKAFISRSLGWEDGKLHPVLPSKLYLTSIISIASVRLCKS